MMDVRWTLNIENFGKIERANIEISPMMLFVGDNNSGKSYVMSLLWGIFTFSGGLFDQRAFETEEYRLCEAWYEQRKSNQDVVTFDDEMRGYMLNWFNVLLNRDKEKIVERIFNYPLPVGSLSLSDYYERSPIKFILFDEESFSPESEVYHLPVEMETKRILTFLCHELIIGRTLGIWHPLYLPASRTGFMLTYKTLVANLIDPITPNLNQGENDQYKSDFPSPVTRFLRLLVQTNVSQNAQYGKTAEFIEQKIMLGEVRKDNSPIPNFLFRPGGVQEDLPLHVTSSLVSELSPIVLFLKSKRPFSLFMIEEPEAHLHLSMQKLLTTALVRLVNQGLPIWLTTHSDTVFQQVNNMIKLFHHSDKEQMANELGYEMESDSLNPIQVRAYQFSVQDDGRTVVEPLQLTEYGFVVPTFYETLVNLTSETLKLQESEEDAD